MKRKNTTIQQETTPMKRVGDKLSFKDRFDEEEVENIKQKGKRSKSKRQIESTEARTRSNKKKGTKSVSKKTLKSVKKNLSKTKAIKESNVKSSSSNSNLDEEDLDEFEEINNNMNLDDNFLNNLFNISQTSKTNTNRYNSNLINSQGDYNFQNADLRNFENFEKFPCDHSLIKLIEVEIILNYTDNNSNSNLQNSGSNQNSNLNINQNSNISYTATKNENYIKLIKNFFENNNFSYYEYTNCKMNLHQTNSFDLNNFEYLYEKNVGEKHRSDIIREINYLEAMPSLFNKFLKGESYFYFLTPLVNYYFFNHNKYFENCYQEYINKSGVIITNVFKNFENKFKEYGIKYDKIKNSNSNTPKKKKLKKVFLCIKFNQS